MKFSFEVPTAHLEYFHPYQDYIFALSFMLEDENYLRYINSCHEKNLPLIIDNSINELEQVTTARIIWDYAKRFPNAKVISADWLDWGMMSQIKEAEELARLIPKERIITPINNVNWIGYYKNQGFKNIAMGYNVRYLSDSDLVKLKGTHFLGLNSIRELFVAQPASCDTGLPIKLAKANMTIEKWIKAGCPHLQLEPEFFSWKLTSVELWLASKNMNKLKEIGELIND